MPAIPPDAFTNYACFAASMSQSPSWRPSFKYYNAWLSLAGAVLCVVAMFAMDWINSLVSIIIGVLLYLYVESLDAEMNWGTAGESRKYLRALQSVTALQALRGDHVKTFRPQYLVLAGDPNRRRSLVKFVSLLRQGRGIMVVGHVLLPEAAAKLLKAHRQAEGNADGPAGSGAAQGKHRGTFADDLFEQWQAHTASDTTVPVSPMRGASSSHFDGEGEGGHHEPLPSLMDAIAAAENQRSKDLKVRSLRKGPRPLPCAGGADSRHPCSAALPVSRVAWACSGCTRTRTCGRAARRPTAASWTAWRPPPCTRASSHCSRSLAWAACDPTPL